MTFDEDLASPTSTGHVGYEARLLDGFLAHSSDPSLLDLPTIDRLLTVLSRLYDCRVRLFLPLPDGARLWEGGRWGPVDAGAERLVARLLSELQTEGAVVFDRAPTGEGFEAADVENLLAVHVLLGGGRRGVLVLVNRHSPHTPSGVAFLTHDKKLLAVVADLLGSHVRETRAERELSLLQRLGHLSQEVLRATEFDEQLSAIWRFLRDCFACDHGAWLVYRPHSNRLEVERRFDVAAESRIEQRTGFAIGQGIAGRAYQRSRPVVCNDPARDPDYVRLDGSPRSGTHRSLLCIPLAFAGFDGVLTMIDKQLAAGGQFTEADERVACSIAGSVGLLLDHCLRQRQASIESALRARLLELDGAKDAYAAVAKVVAQLFHADACEVAIGRSHGGHYAGAVPGTLLRSLVPLRAAPQGVSFSRRDRVATAPDASIPCSTVLGFRLAQANRRHLCIWLARPLPAALFGAIEEHGVRRLGETILRFLTQHDAHRQLRILQTWEEEIGKMARGVLDSGQVAIEAVLGDVARLGHEQLGASYAAALIVDDRRQVSRFACSAPLESREAAMIARACRVIGHALRTGAIATRATLLRPGNLYERALHQSARWAVLLALPLREGQVLALGLLFAKRPETPELIERVIRSLGAAALARCHNAELTLRLQCQARFEELLYDAPRLTDGDLAARIRDIFGASAGSLFAGTADRCVLMSTTASDVGDPSRIWYSAAEPHYTSLALKLARTVTSTGGRTRLSASDAWPEVSRSGGAKFLEEPSLSEAALMVTPVVVPGRHVVGLLRLLRREPFLRVEQEMLEDLATRLAPRFVEHLLPGRLGDAGRRLARLTAMATLASGLAHELKTPLAIVTSTLTNVIEAHSGNDAAALRARLDKARQQAHRASTLLDELVRHFWPGPRPQGESEAAHRSLADLLDNGLLPSLRTLAFERSVALEIEASPAAQSTHVPTDGLAAVLTSVITNGIQAAGPGGRVQVHAESHDAAVTLSVEDSGPGVPEALRDAIFNPFFTTRSDGTGLGLSTARAILERAGGRIEVTTGAALKGARFIVTLPATPREPRHA